MTKLLFVTLDLSEKWLDKQREIDGYTVDGFTVAYPISGKSVEVTFFKWEKPIGYEDKCSYEITPELRSSCYFRHFHAKSPYMAGQSQSTEPPTIKIVGFLGIEIY